MLFRSVTEALEIDVTGGEQDWDMATWARMIGMHAVDVVQPDVMYMGGMARTLEVARMAQEAEAQRESTVQQEAEAQEPAAGEGA